VAAPADATRNTTNISTSADPWTVNLPASISAGDLLIVHGRTGGSPTFNLPSGWSWLVQNHVADASDDVTSIIWRIADGAEGATLSWDLSATAKGSTLAYRITGHDFGILDVQVAIGTGANANPPVTTTLPSDDYLILVFAGLDGETQTYTVPTNYVNLQTANSGTAGIATTNNVTASASRALTGITSEDPGAFTNGAPSTGWTTFTLAVRQTVPRTMRQKVRSAELEWSG
jgi:hypothetical protein